MRALFVPSLFVFLGITLISSKPLEESKNQKELRSLNKTELAKMIANSKLLEKLANETYFAKVPTSEETYKTKDPTDEETYLSQDPTDEETKDPTAEETYLSKDPTGEPTKDEFFIQEDDEEEDDEDEATVDKPTDAQPVNFLKYPAVEEDFKPYPRFAILRNGYVHRMSLDF